MISKSQVALPTDRIDEALLSCAIPGFWGDLTVDIHLRPMAATEVDLHIERRSVTQVQSAKSDLAVVPSNERVSKARRAFSEFAGKLVLECPVSHILFRFRDGHVTSCELGECSVVRSGV